MSVDLIKIQHALTTTATVIGFVVMFAWVLIALWFFATIVGEFRFNRIMKRRLERESDNHNSSWVFENPYAIPNDGDEFRTDTREYPAFYMTEGTSDIDFTFHSEDDLPTEETGAVFDIYERFPDEFARAFPPRQQDHER